MTKSKVNFLFPFLCLVLSLSFPAASARGVERGLSISLSSALPALFPALVLTGILTSQVRAKSRRGAILLPFFLGLLGGFPMGARAVGSMVKEGKLSKKDGETLLLFCNRASPAFLMGYCGSLLPGGRKTGLLLFIVQAVLSLLFLLCFFGKTLFFEKGIRGEISVQKTTSFWEIIPKCIGEAGNSFLYIMSCILFFSFFSELVLHLLPPHPFWEAAVRMLLELTGGIAAASSLPLSCALPLSAFACGFGGLSVQLQSAGILQEASLSVKKYFGGSLLFSSFFLLVTLFLSKLL